MNLPQRMHLLGTVCNFVDRPPTSQLDHALQAGLVLVAADARAFASFRGGTPQGEWVVTRKKMVDVGLDPWPNTGWRFNDEASARNAYQTLRNHVLSKLPGVEPRDDRSPQKRLLDASAWGETFHWQGQDVLFMSCDQSTEGKLLQGMTDRLKAFKIQGNGPVAASYNTQISPHVVGITTGEGGLAEHVLTAFTPGDENELVAAGLPNSDQDTEPFDLPVPSGILILAWGRLDGAGFAAQAQGQDVLNVFHNLIGNRVAAPLPTPWDGAAPGAYAWGIRVRPGTYRCALRFLETEQGISAMALSHVEAQQLWPDMAAGPQPMNQQQVSQHIAAGQAAQQQIAAGGGGDPDPLVFPGQRLARLSDYVRLMKAMQTGDMNGALRAAGLDMASYGTAAGQWGMKMASDPVLTAKYVAMIQQP
jgi:hypothetical protein